MIRTGRWQSPIGRPLRSNPATYTGMFTTIRELMAEMNMARQTADWIIDMGPEGGAGGRTVVGEGTPEDIAANPTSHTGVYLRRVL